MSNSPCFIVQLAGSLCRLIYLISSKDTRPCLVHGHTSIKQCAGSSLPWSWWWWLIMLLPMAWGFQQWFEASFTMSLSTACGSSHSDAVHFWKICMFLDKHFTDIWGWGSSEQMLVFWVASVPFPSPIHSHPPEVALCHMGVWHTAGGAVQLAFTFMCKPARKHFYSYWPRFLLPMTNHCWAIGVSITAFKCCRPVFSKVYLCFFFN